jgi:hypothetical protein
VLGNDDIQLLGQLSRSRGIRAERLTPEHVVGTS